MLSHNNIISVPLAKLQHHLDTMANIEDNNNNRDTNNTNQVQNDIINNAEDSDPYVAGALAIHCTEQWHSLGASTRQ